LGNFPWDFAADFLWEILFFGYGLLHRVRGIDFFLCNSQGFRGMITGFPENIPEGSTNSGE
jgi:hypothetical protein